MPATSKAQFHAMQAAKHGRSTIGIPASVGRDFVAATPSPGRLPARAEAEGKAEPGDRPAEERGEPAQAKPKGGGQFQLKKSGKKLGRANR